MNRNRAYFPRDDAPVDAGDGAFVGMNMRLDPSMLPPGFVSDGRNMDCDRNTLRTRGGVAKMLWGNEIDSDGRVIPWGTLYSKPTVFKDPNGSEWIIFAANGRVYATVANNEPIPLTLPTGVSITNTVSFTQAFNLLYMDRDRCGLSLKLSSIDTGFEDAIAHWSTSTAYSYSATAPATVVWGPWNSVSSITSSGLLAIVTSTTAHGLIDGADVTIRGANQAAFNGRWTVTVIDDVSFSYSYGGGSGTATGTITWSPNLNGWRNNAATLAGEEPGVSSKWERDYTIMPAGIHGVYVNNRRLLPTRWNPSADSATGAYSGSRDFVAASYITDTARFSVRNEFRINQGDNHELVALAKIGPSSVLAFKSGSVGLLSNVYGDNLPDITLEMLITNYGLVNPYAWALAGKDVFFMAPNRGVISLTQTVNGQIQGVDMPLSRDIQPLIDRIDWSNKDKIRFAYYDNRLYVAVPLDEATCEGTDLFANLVYDTLYSLDTGTLALDVGTKYRWTPNEDSDDVLVVNGETFSGEEVEFTYGGGTAYLTSTIASSETVVDSTFRRILENVNNAVLVYDFLLQAWQTPQTGPDLAVAEWVVATVNGRERLLAFTEDGILSLWDGFADGDQVWSPLATDTGIGRDEIDCEAVTRGYTAQETGFKANRFAELVLGTWAPKYTVAVASDGVEEETVIVEDRTRDRTKYDKPFTAQDWVETNENDDFDTPFRQDYSIQPSPESGLLLLEDGSSYLLLEDGVGRLVIASMLSIDLQDGIELDRLQEQRHRVKVPNKQGRSFQVRVRNRQGRCEVRAMKLEMTAGIRSEGVAI